MAELLTGTFYLLMLALGAVAAAAGAHAGLQGSAQLALAAVVAGATTATWHWQRSHRQGEAPANANPNVSLDIGEIVQVNTWGPDGSAHVMYRGAQWTAVHRVGVEPTPGPHRVTEMVGNRLLVEKT